MVQDIILDATINMQDIDRKLSALQKKSVPLTGVTRSFRDQGKLVAKQIKTLNDQLQVGKTTGLFGDPKQIAQTTSEINKLRERTDRLVNSTKRLPQQYNRYLEAIKQTNIKKLSPLVQGAFTGKGLNVHQQNRLQKVGSVQLAKELLMRKNLTQAYRDNNSEILKYIANTSKMQKMPIKGLDVLKENLKHTSARLMELQTRAKAAQNPMVNLLNKLGVAGNSLGQIFGTMIGKVTTWLAAMMAVRVVFGVFNAFVTEIKALQDAQVDLQRVMNATGETAEEIDKALEKSTKTVMAFARETNKLTGALYTDTVRAFANVTRAGFDMEESMMLTRAALIAVNVSELTVENSTRFLIATMRQFNMTADQSLYILDQWNELGKRTGTTVQGVAEAVSRSGKAFKAVGGTLAQLNALAAVTIESTGESGEKIGTMLKTLSARFADVNRRNSFREVVQQFTGNDIFEGGQFENMFVALGKLSESWDTLGDRQQAMIAKSAAGIRQYSRFLSIVENFDRAIDALAISINSQNSALEENRRRVKTLDFQIRRLKGAFSELTQSAGVSMMLQGVTNVVNLLGDALNALSTPIGKIIFGMTTLTTVTTLYGKSLMALTVAHPLIAFLTLATGLVIGFYNHIENATRQTEHYKEQLAGAASSLLEFGQNMDTLVESYKRTRSEDIAKLFKDVANVNIGVLVKDSDNLETSLKRVKDHLREIGSFEMLFSNTRRMFKDLQEGTLKDLFAMAFAESKINTATAKKVESNFLKSFGLDKTSVMDMGKSELNVIRKQLNKFKKNIKKDFETEEGMDLMNKIVYGEEGLIRFRVPAAREYLRKILDDALLLVKTRNGKQVIDISEMQERVMDTWKTYYTELNKLEEQAYERRLERNREYVDAIVDPLTELSDMALSERIVKGFQNIGDVVFNNFTDTFKTNLTEALTGTRPLNMAEQLELKIKQGGISVEENIKNGFGTSMDELRVLLNDLTEKISILRYGKKLSDLGDVPSVPTKTADELSAIRRHALGITQLSLSTGGMGATSALFSGFANAKKDNIQGKAMTQFDNMFKEMFQFDEATQQTFGTMFEGAGLGTTGASLFGKQGNFATMAGGAILAQIGSAFGPLGALAGGLLGGLFGEDKKDKKDSKNMQVEQLKANKESVKELRSVNRNLESLVDNFQPYALPESYYFSIAANRGLVG